MSSPLPLPHFGSRDAREADHPGDLVEAPVRGRSQPVGGFRLDLATSRWTWTDEIFTMHGFLPGEVVPSTALALAHMHPEDRARAADILERACTDGAPFSSVHRVIDARGNLRVVGVTGQGRSDACGEIIELVGYFVDLSDSQREAVDREATEHIAAGAAGRASIEQAKGILMAGLHVTDDAAFALLRGRSNDTNIPLRTLAREFVDVTRGGLHGHPGDARITLAALDAAITRLIGGVRTDNEPELGRPG